MIEQECTVLFDYNATGNKGKQKANVNALLESSSMLYVIFLVWRAGTYGSKRFLWYSSYCEFVHIYTFIMYDQDKT